MFKKESDRAYRKNVILVRLIFLLSLLGIFIVACAVELRQEATIASDARRVQELEAPKYVFPRPDKFPPAPLEPSLLNVPLGKQTQPDHIPDRLLVKIKPSEIAVPFRPEPIDCHLDSFTNKGVLPKNVGIAKILYRGLTRENKAMLSAHLLKPVPESALLAAFEHTKGRLVRTVEGRVVRGPTGGLMVEVDPGDISISWLDICRPNYFYLKKVSHLNHAFRKIGVVSMRRVFRSVEQPVRDRPGYFTVHKFKDLLQIAKKMNPVRSSRAYRVKALTPVLDKTTAQERIPEVGKISRVELSRGSQLGEIRTFEDSIPEVPDNMENWFILRLAPKVNAQQALKVIEKLSVVEKVSLDFPAKPAQINDPEWNDQWGLRNTGTFQGVTDGLTGFDINIQAAWAVPAQPLPVIVAVMDTGFNESLNELSSRLWTNSGEGSVANGQDDDCNGYIDDIHGVTTYDRFAVDYSASPACSVSPGGPSMVLGAHGTAVAGVIAAQTNNSYGIAGTAGTDNVQLMNIALGPFSGREWPPGWSDFAEGLFYAISPTFQENSRVRGADIVNMSLLYGCGGYLMYEAIYASLDAGLILVAAVGNDGVRFTYSESGLIGVYPASLPGVIAVGGSTRNGRWWTSSNYGPRIDLVAPASEVRTISFDVNNPAQTTADVITAGGTSLSTAFVSGGAAVVLRRYPDVTAPYMRYWLRAKARDIIDPLGDGSNRVGDDEWTGAGMLNIGDATTALSNPNDQPIVIGLSMERSKDFSGYYGWRFPYRPLAVGGQPDLGIRVKGASLRSWSLSYGVGDAPQTWVDIPVSPTTLTQQEMDFEVLSGNNFLNTDVLSNRQVYTLRLEAENRAGTKFTTYNWFVPTRAEILFPPPSWTLVPNWGWLPVGGFVDTRPSSSFQIALYDDLDQILWNTGSQTLWTPGPYTPPHLAERTATVAHPLLSNFGSYFSGGGGFPAQSSGLSEGWKKYQLTVQSNAGVDQDSVRFYVDSSHFTAEYWPLRHEPIEYPVGSYGTENLADYPLWPWWSYYDILLVSGSGSLTEPRVFLQTSESVMALDRNGALVWERRPADYQSPYPWSFHSSPNMVIEDVDGNGRREVLFAVNEYVSGIWKSRVVLLNAADGTAYNQNWPVEYVTPRDVGVGEVAVGDVMGDSKKEIMFVELRRFWYGIPAEELAPLKLHLLDINGQELWTHEFPIELQYVDSVQVADIDGDGKDEILLGIPGQILKGNNTFMVGWDVPVRQYILGTVKKGSGNAKDVLVYGPALAYGQERLYLKSPSGTVQPGWPIDLGNISYADAKISTGQILPGGDEEIFICSDTIRVLDTSGSRVTSVPEISLNGACGRLELRDVDQDGVNEFLVLVHRFPDNPAPSDRVGSFVEAYKLDGTRLADTDNRWPIVVAPRRGSGYPQMNRQVAFGDVDGDNKIEILQLLYIGPYGMDLSDIAPSAQIEVLHLP
jgi:hypothetical protein